MHQFFFSLLLILLPTQLGYHFWPSWSMVLGRRVDYLSPTLYLTDILIVLLALSWLRHIRHIFFFLLFLFAVLNIYVSVSGMVASYFWVKWIAYLFVGYYVIKTKPSLPSLSLVLSLSVVYSSVIAIGQFLLQHSIGGPLWLLGERTFTLDTPGIARITVFGRELLRAYGTFPHPNVLGGFLAIVVPFIFYYLPAQKKAVRLIVLFLGVVALVCTFSRSAWVVFGIGMVYMEWRKKIMWTPLLVIGIALSIVFLVPFSISDESVVVRGQLNAAAFQMITTAPLFGVGLGNFLVALPEYLPSRTIYFLQPAHNIYLLLASEIGVIAAIIVGWLLFKYVRWSPPVVGLFLLGCIDHYLLTLPQGRLLLILFLALAYRARD